MRAIYLLLSLLRITPTFAQNDADGQRCLITCRSNVTPFEGMYYSAHDYCAPFSGASVASTSQKLWVEQNKQLLFGRDSALVDLIGGLQLDGTKAASLKKWQEGIYAQFHESDKLYMDLAASKDMHIACSKKLGEMVSHTTSFQRIAPSLFEFWKRRQQP